MVTAISRRISKGRTPRTKGRRLGKRREEDNFPASHGNKGGIETNFAVRLPELRRRREDLKEKEMRKKKKDNDKKIGRS
jgi:hypothetical protein